MRQVKRLLPYVRRYVQMAVYDVLDAEGAEYWKNESGAVVARLSVYGNVSTFSLSPAFGLRERQHLQPFGGDMRHGNRTDGFRT